jgi:hypothetical protein
MVDDGFVGARAPWESAQATDPIAENEFGMKDCAIRCAIVLHQDHRTKAAFTRLPRRRAGATRDTSEGVATGGRRGLHGSRGAAAVGPGCPGPATTAHQRLGHTGFLRQHDGNPRTRVRHESLHSELHLGLLRGRAQYDDHKRGTCRWL